MASHSLYFDDTGDLDRLLELTVHNEHRYL
jgi:hypothetical protein